MEKFKTAEEIKKAFIAEGWRADIEFKPLTLDAAEKIGVFDIIQNIKKGRKYFRMTATGNIFDDRGEIRLYNIKPIENPADIATCR